MSLKLAALAAVSCFFLIPAGLAQQLDEMVVTATRTPVPVTNLNVPIIVISREDIARSLATDVGDLLAEHVGVEVARTGGPGQPAAVFIRGANSDHTIVLVDGVRVNPGTIGGAPIQNISPEMIERIEIVKGPRSTLYGTDAIGGVINIFTRADANRGLAASVSTGRYGTRTVHGDGGMQSGARGNLGFSVSDTRSDGFPALAGSTDPRGYRNLSANLAGSYQASDALTLSARGWRARGNSEYSDFFAAPVDEDFTNAAYSLEARWQPSKARAARLTLSQAQDDIAQRQSSDYVRTHRNTLDAQTDWQVGPQQFTFGALLTRESAQALSFGLPFDVTTAVNMGYVQDQITYGPNAALLAVGYTQHQTFGHQLTWNAEYGRSFAPGTRVSLAAGSAFHAPDATDRYGFGGNPQLRPELSRQLELTLHQPLGSHHELWTSLFENRIDDLINYVVTDPLTFAGRNENIDRARIRGVEIGYRYQGARWRLRAEAAFNDPRDRDTGAPLLRRARSSWVVALERRSGRLELGANASRSGRRHDVGFPAAVALPPYTLLNLSAAFAFNARWSLQARLDNALDERYQLAYGYNSARRSLIVASRYRFN